VWSQEQKDIFAYFETGQGHLMVDAVAGSGKTTTIVEGVKRAPEKNPLCVAFNKKIADALNEKLVDSYASAKTLHGLGYAMIRRQWKGMPVAEGSTRAEQITDAVIPAGDKAGIPKLIYRLITNFHSKAREICPLTWNEDVLWAVGLKFDLLPDDKGWGKYGPSYVIERTAEALSWATENAPERSVGIDYADMVFLPLVWNLSSRDYDLVVVDERQDMTQAQLELALRSVTEGGRIVLVGDKYQAIYGFRGADSANGEEVAKQLGAVNLPLTTSYRCDEAIIVEAQRLVPHIRARNGAGEGTVDAAGYEDCLVDVLHPQPVKRPSGQHDAGVAAGRHPGEDGRAGYRTGDSETITAVEGRKAHAIVTSIREDTRLGAEGTAAVCVERAVERSHPDHRHGGDVAGVCG
jgi:superfamily I DNA/RNA helicase